jgi:hypothetical protein
MEALIPELPVVSREIVQLHGSTFTIRLSR